MSVQGLDDALGRLQFWVRETSPDGCALRLRDQAAVSEVEINLGLKLPADYREFLGQYGAIRLDNALVVASVDDEEKIGWHDRVGPVSFFGIYGVSPSGDRSHFDLLLAAREHTALLPKGIIPFAEMRDDLFCISCVEETAGTVYLKVPEQFDDDNPEELLFPQSPSFLEFLRSLRTMTDAEADAWYRARGG